MARIDFICPNYGFKAWEVMHASIASFWARTPHDKASLTVVDDGTKEWTDEHTETVKSWCPEGAQVRVLRMPTNSGVTACWNLGLRTTPENVTHSLVANNDILFVDGWYEPLLRALDAGYSLAGPVSNAPGITSRRPDGSNPASVRRWIQNYRPSDLYVDRKAVMDFLKERNRNRIHPVKLNGFCILGKVEDFRSGAFDANNVYRPRNDFMPSGKRNPTPLMTGNEDEIQHRWNKLGRKFALCADSFIFHYRSVTRGKRYRTGEWMEKTDVSLESIA